MNAPIEVRLTNCYEIFNVEVDEEEHHVTKDDQVNESNQVNEVKVEGEGETVEITIDSGASPSVRVTSHEESCEKVKATEGCKACRGEWHTHQGGRRGGPGT